MAGSSKVIELDDTTDEEEKAALPAKVAPRPSGRATRSTTSTSSSSTATTSRNASNRGSTSTAVVPAPKPVSRKAARGSGTSIPATARPTAPAPKQAKLRSSTSTTPESTPQQQEDEDDDIPTFAARVTKTKTAAPAPTPAARPKPKAKSTAAASPQKKAVPMEPKQLEERRRRQQEDAEEVNFFSRAKTITFKSKLAPGVVINKASAKPAPVAAATTPAKAAKVAKPVVEIDLDEQESDSSSTKSSHSESEDSDEGRKTKRRKTNSADGSMSDSSDDLAKKSNKGAAKRGRGRPPGSKSKKGKKEQTRMTSPLKGYKRGQEEDSDNQSSSSTSFSSSSSSSEKRKAKRKRKKEKDMPKEETKARSLSPIENVDTFAVAHALQDVRRNAALRQVRPIERASEEEEELELLGAVPRAGSSARPLEERGRSQSASNLERAPSASQHPEDRARLTPLPEETELTEEEKQLRYGPVVAISVKMVSDPRIPDTPTNEASKKAWELPVIAEIRQKETFEAVFQRVAITKGMTRGALVLKYENTQVYSVGTPMQLRILKQGTLKGYHQEVYQYIESQRKADRERQFSEGKAAQLAAIAERAAAKEREERERPSAPSTSRASRSGRQGPAIDLDGSDAGNDSDIEMVGIPAGVRRATSASQPPPQTQAVNRAPAEGSIRLTLRGGKDMRVNVAVQSTKTVKTLVRHYLKTAKLDMEKAAATKVIFDGEELGHGTTIEDAGLEDEDTVDVKVPT